MEDTKTNEGPPETLLAIIDKLKADCAAKGGNPCSLIGIPRELALRLAGEWAERQKKIVTPGQIETLLDGRIAEVLLALDELPVLAMPMPGAIVCAWTWPFRQYKENGGFCEHPDYPSLPFSTYMWDAGMGVEIPRFLEQTRQEAIEITARPSICFEPCMHLMASCRPLNNGPITGTAALEVETLSDDEAIAFAQFQMGLDDNEGAIQRALTEQGGYAIKLRNMTQDFLARVKQEFATRLNALAEVAPPDEHGFQLVTVTPNKIIGSAV